MWYSAPIFVATPYPVTLRLLYVDETLGCQATGGTGARGREGSDWFTLYSLQCVEFDICERRTCTLPQLCEATGARLGCEAEEGRLSYVIKDIESCLVLPPHAGSSDWCPACYTLWEEMGFFGAKVKKAHRRTQCI